MTTILAAIDDSAAATPVLEAALALAPVFGAQVEALQVADDLGRTAHAAALSLHVPIRTVAGDPFEQIRRRAEDEDTVVVVLGARGRPSGPRPAGHLALGLVGAMPKPVVMVPPEAHPPARMRRVLIALAGTPRSARYLQRTIELAAASDLELLVVHVDDEDSIPSFSDQVQYEVEAYAAEFLARYLPGAPEARLEMRIGLPADEIFKAVADVEPDILAIGWPQSDDPSRGAVAREIVERSHLPVLLVALADNGP